MTALDTRPLGLAELMQPQRDVLFGMELTGSHLVSGPPGSGKSVLAAQRASMLALSGEPVTLLTYSNLLKQYIAPSVAALAPRADVSVATVHTWLGDWYQRHTGRRPPMDADTRSYDWSAVHMAATSSTESAPILVIDEGQDLPVDFYRFCRLIGAEVTVFADEHQRISDTQSTLAEITRALGGCEHHSLTGNYRNTEQIARFAACFDVEPLAPEPSAAPVRDGCLPVLHRWDADGRLAEFVTEYVKKNPDLSIAVVCRRTDWQYRLLHRLELVDQRLRPQMYTSRAPRGRYRQLDLSRRGVFIVNRKSVKGLGFDTAVIPDTHLDANLDPTSATIRMEYYVLATRARHELHLAYAGASEPPLLAAIGQDLLRRDHCQQG